MSKGHKMQRGACLPLLSLSLSLSLSLGNKACLSSVVLFLKILTENKDLRLEGTTEILQKKIIKKITVLQILKSQHDSRRLKNLNSRPHNQIFLTL